MTDPNSALKDSNPGDSLDGIVRGISETPQTTAMIVANGIRCKCSEEPIQLCQKLELENNVLRAAVESWEGTFERFGLEPETAIHAVNDIEREYERIRSRAEKMAAAWEIDSTINDIAEAMDEAVNEYRALIPANDQSHQSRPK